MANFAVINYNDMNIVSKSIGKDAFRLGRALGFEHGELDSLSIDHGLYGNQEVVVRLLIKWQNKMGEDATCERLAEALESIPRQDIADEMMAAHFPGQGLSSAEELARGEPRQLFSLPDSRSENDDRSITQLSTSTGEATVINDEATSDECWLCSIGGYYRIKVSRLYELTPARGAATLSSIKKVYADNGVKVSTKSFLDWNSVEDYLRKRLVRGAKLKVVLAFDVRDDAIRHMIVLKACRTANDEIFFRSIDYQKEPDDPARITDNKLPTYAKNPFLIFETDHDVYESPAFKSIPQRI